MAPPILPADTQLQDITHTIQLAVAPVFLLTAIATTLSVLTTRLGRIVDRARRVEGRLHAASAEDVPLPDASFDLVTSTEVLEHVPDDARAFAEIRRVLVPGGMTIFSVPLSGAEQTVERARATPDGIVHLLPPEYHGDRLRGRNAVLAYRTYGRDIVARLLAAGFRRALLDVASERAWLGHGRQVVVAVR